MKKKYKISLIFLFSAFLIFSLASFCSASAMDYLDLQVPFGELPAKLKLSGSTFAEYVKALFVFSSAAISVFAIIMIMVGGAQWVLSEGTPDKIGKAKETIFKAFIGLFIALFSITILQIVNPGAVTFEPLSPEKVESIGCCKIQDSFKAITEEECSAQDGQYVAVGDCNQLAEINSGPTTDGCPSNMGKECGGNYMEEGGISCIGKKCEDPNEKCIKDSQTDKWKCDKCLDEGGTCTAGTDNPCCSNTCSPEGKCAAASQVADTLGKSCNDNKDCEAAGLYCNSNWKNKCSYGRWGAPCDVNLVSEAADILLKSECDYKNGFYCSQDGRNTCIRPQPYGRCDPDPGIAGTKVCPDGYKCVDPYLCNEEEADHNYADYHCQNDVAGSSDQWSVHWASTHICIPEDTTCICHGTSASQCTGVKYTDNKTATYDSYGDDVCVPANLGTPCESNSDCAFPGGKCNDDGPNMCVKGEVGDGCDSHSDCVTNNCCEKFGDRGVCVPPDVCK